MRNTDVNVILGFNITIIDLNMQVKQIKTSYQYQSTTF